jgi:PAS domain-containing protein
MEHAIPKNSVLRSVLDAIPSLVFLTDGNVKILDANRAAREWLGTESGRSFGQLGGEILRCVVARDAENGCGSGDCCPACAIRRSVGVVNAGRTVHRQPAHMVIETGKRSEDHWFLVSASPVVLDGQGLVMLVLEEVSQLVELRESLPFCPGCGRPRGDALASQQAEHFLWKHAGFWFPHELCADCLREHSPSSTRLHGAEGSG